VAGNSAFGALGIAYLMGARRIAIIGLDATRETYARGVGRPRGGIDHVPGLFATALPQLERRGAEVMNGSPHSRVVCFPRCTPEQALEWISEPLPAGGSMLKLLVLGGAACVWADAEKALALGDYDAVCGVKDMIADWPGRLDYGVTLHPERAEQYLRERKASGYPGRPEIWGHKNSGSGARVMVAKTTQDWAGSSGLLAVKIGLLEGFGRIVLAGVPMEASAGHYKRGQTWQQAPRYRSGWTAHKDEMLGTVRSLSGWTRELLGAPDADWLNSAD